MDNTVFSSDARICKDHSQLKLKFHYDIFISLFRDFVFNPFVLNALFLYLLNTSENLKVALGTNGLIKWYIFKHKWYVVRCAIWYQLYNLKNGKNFHGRVLILVKLQAKACNFTEINTPAWVFFTFLKLYKWYQIGQRTTYGSDLKLGMK